MPKASEEFKFPIKITNFINPHLFFFKLDHSDYEIDQKIEKLALEEKWAYPSGYKANQGEMVLAYLRAWDKWVRAEIDLILQEGRKTRYVIWCVDYGIPVELDSTCLLPSNDEIQLDEPCAYIGGLARCVPIENINKETFVEGTEDAYKLKDFTAVSLVAAQHLIDEAAEIKFIPRQIMHEHIFGDVRFTEHKGVKVDLLNELTKGGEVKVIDDYIPRDILKLQTIMKKRYEDNRGQLNTHNLSAMDAMPALTPFEEKKVRSAAQVMDDSDEMILDWSRQSIQASKEIKLSMVRNFKNVIRSLDHFTGRCEDIPIQKMGLFNSFRSILTTKESIHTLRSGDSCSNVGGSKVYMSKPGVMKRLTERLKTASIQTDAPKKPEIQENTGKKVVYIPSGFESDLYNFQKYNQF